VALERTFIPSGKNRLDVVFVHPEAGPAKAAVLILHGIGETVQRWFPVQQLLALNGVASLVFDYSGYGRSTGTVDWSQCEDDAVVAFEHLRGLAYPLPVSVLGFSLGSGIAAAMIHRVQANRLVLCAAFTSFRNGARSVGLPEVLSRYVPPIWCTQQSLRRCSLPVIVVHGEKDGLFPVRMARELANACGGPAELIVVPNVAHNQPFRRPDLSYWGLIVSRLAGEEADGGQGPRI
jgi:alpha-beta hydrolase superfamily lysophospholipase